MGINHDDFMQIINTTHKATLVAVGEEVDYTDIPDQWMPLFEDVIEDVRDHINRGGVGE